jgi:hypothetical protein
MSTYHDRPTATPDHPRPTRTTYTTGAFGVRVPAPRNVRRSHPWPAPAARRDPSPGRVACTLAWVLPVALSLLSLLVG